MARISASLERFDATHHLNGNHVAAVRGDEAEHTCYYQAQHVRLGLPGGEKFLGGGRYDNRLRRTPDGWRFTHRRITSVWSEGNPAVITILTIWAKTGLAGHGLRWISSIATEATTMTPPNRVASVSRSPSSSAPSADGDDRVHVRVGGDYGRRQAPQRDHVAGHGQQ